MWMRFERMGIYLRWVPLSAVASSIISASSLTTLTKGFEACFRLTNGQLTHPNDYHVFMTAEGRWPGNRTGWLGTMASWT